MIDMSMMLRMIAQSADPHKVIPFSFDSSMITLTPDEMLLVAKAVWAEAVLEERKACVMVCEIIGEDGEWGAGEIWSERCASEIRKRSNVEVTGAARLYRAASSDRRERGRPPGWASCG